MKIYKNKTPTAEFAEYRAELTHTPEEQHAIAEQIVSSLENYEDIDFQNFRVIFNDDEGRVFDFDINPLNYMYIVIDMVLQKVQKDWGIFEMSPLLYLEQELKDRDYFNKKYVAKLSAVVDPFRTQWKGYIGIAL